MRNIGLKAESRYFILTMDHDLIAKTSIAWLSIIKKLLALISPAVHTFYFGIHQHP